MLESFSKNAELKFKELSPEEKQARGILGRLYGPIASVVKATRNGRKYTESLWEKVFDNPLTKEMFAQGGVPGELDHPADREETCSEKIAIMMPEPPTKDRDGQLIGYFDIIDTPCGRIAYALAKYGFNLGISSRGTGDTFMDYDGQETVDEDTYSFNAFDLVLLPACKDARLQLAEGLDMNKQRFDKAINEALEQADEGAKKIMTETLENLKFYEDSSTSETQDVETGTDEKEVADNDGTTLVTQLQEALKEVNRLNKQVVALQEKLSVSYTKEVKLEDANTTLRDTVRRLSESVKKSSALSAKVETLQSQLDESKETVVKQTQMLEAYKNKYDSINRNRSSLKESLATRDSEVTSLQEKVLLLNENINTLKSAHETKVSKLTEELAQLKADSQIKSSQYAKKLSQSNELVESYKAIADRALSRYIQSKATNLGISVNEIKNRLSEGYSFDEIDSVCESLRSYKLNMSKLPFSMGAANVSRVALKEDTSTQRFTNPDDVVDGNLFNLLK